jgi:hypothetical protein
MRTQPRSDACAFDSEECKIVAAYQQAQSHHLSGTSSTRPLIPKLGPKARANQREGVCEIEGGSSPSI